jgi:hypothetical protein
MSLLAMPAMGWVVESLSPVLSACSYVPGTMTMPMLVVTGVAWTGLQIPE